MARSQHKSRRKASGGRYHSSRSKRKFELAGFSTQTKIGDAKIKTKRVIGGNTKTRTLSTKIVNAMGKDGKAQKVEILNVVENPANPNLVRRNILTRGAIVETKIGKVKITNRPGQEGAVSGTLM